MKHCLCLISFVLFFINSNAQETGENKVGTWYMCYGSFKLSRTFSITSGVEIRAYKTTTNFNQFLILTGLSYHFNPALKVTLGYLYLNTDPTFIELPDEVRKNEHRLYEQVNFKNKVWNFNLSHRYRLEQHFKTISNKTNMQLRIRYRLQLSIPLSKKVFLRTYDEIFLNFKENVFSQNRLFAAIGVKVIKNGNIQLGYLKNSFNNIAFNRLQLGVFFTTNFKNTKPLRNKIL